MIDRTHRRVRLQLVGETRKAAFFNILRVLDQRMLFGAPWAVPISGSENVRSRVA